jgi:hypothetical protein
MLQAMRLHWAAGNVVDAVDCAAKAAPYVHPRLVAGAVAVRLPSEMSDEELAASADDAEQAAAALARREKLLLLPPLTHATPERCVGRSMTARGAEHFRRVVLGTASGLLCCSSPRIRMLAGGEGPGGILFRDFAAAYLIGSVSLAIILFDGGLRTDPGASSPRCFLSSEWPPV